MSSYDEDLGNENEIMGLTHVLKVTIKKQLAQLFDNVSRRFAIADINTAKATKRMKLYMDDKFAYVTDDQKKMQENISRLTDDIKKLSQQVQRFKDKIKRDRQEQ